MTRGKKQTCCLCMYKTTMVLASIACMFALTLWLVNHVTYELNKDGMSDTPPTFPKLESREKWFERKAAFTESLEVNEFYRDVGMYLFGYSVTFIVLVTYTDFILRRQQMCY